MEPLPQVLGGAQGRPVIDSDEYERLDAAINQMPYPDRFESGQTLDGNGKPRGGDKNIFLNNLAFYHSLLVGSIRHIGRAAMKVVDTACVWIDTNGVLNTAFNPYYIDELQRVRVQFPKDKVEEDRLRQGGTSGKAWLIRPGYYKLPSFVRGSLFRQALEEKLRASGEDLMPGWSLSLPPEVWQQRPEDLGIDTTRTIAIQLDNRPLIGLFVHEILHVAHLHLLADRKEFSDARRLNFAMDIAIDQFIDDKYNNKWAFFRELFQTLGLSRLEADMPFDYYYQRLGELPKGVTQTPNGPVQVVFGPMPPNTCQGQGQPGQGQPGQGQPGQGQGPGQPRKGPSGPSPAPGTVQVIVVPPQIDNHNWQKPAPVTKFSQSAWLQSFRQKAREYDAGGKGLGTLLRSIDDFLRPSVSWRPYLRRFIGDQINIGRDSTRKRPSRRLGWDAPGSKTVRSGKVIVAIDASGSISVVECMQFFGEIGSFIGQLEIVIVVWDDGIQLVQKAKSRSDLARIAGGLIGGGGTNVLPVFEAILNPSKLSNPTMRSLIANPRGLIVLTDGHLAWPDKQWDILPTLWGITVEENLDKPQFGIPLYVRIEK